MTICIALAMPPRSAPILNTLATISSTHAGHSTQGEYRMRMAPPEPAPRHHSQPRAHQLHRRHQRKRKESRPQERISENRTCDRVSGDPRGIVVRRAGDQPRPEIGKEAPDNAAPARLGNSARELHREETPSMSCANHILRWSPYATHAARSLPC